MSLSKDAKSADFLGNLLAEITTGTVTNKILSPTSIRSILELLYIGSGGQAEKQLQTCLNSSKDDAYGRLAKTRTFNTSNCVKICNIIYVPGSVALKTNYLKLLDGVAEFDKLDLSVPGKEVARINKLVETKTNSMIKDLLTDDSINGNTRMVALNVIYFKADWKYKFDKKKTIKGYNFTALTGKTTKVAMMTQKKKMHYYCSDDVHQVLELRYMGDEFSMGFILPKDPKTVPQVGTSMINEYVQRLKKRELTVCIPKFVHETSFNLIPVMKNLGLNSLFTDLDLSAMMDGGKTQVTTFVHKAKIIVDEEGTEAAAATAVCCTESCTKSTNFIADHTFMYYIRHVATGEILFTGYFTE